jgi:hypothetical protein
MSNEQEMRILKTGECPSLSGKSTLSYQIACNNDNEVHVALTGNSGGGHLNSDWVSLEEIYSILSSQKKPVTSSALQDLYQGKSSNNASFTTAILLKKGLLKISPGNSHYDLIGQTEFQKIVQGLMETAPEEKPAKKKTGKKAKGVTP